MNIDLKYILKYHKYVKSEDLVLGIKNIFQLERIYKS